MILRAVFTNTDEALNDEIMFAEMVEEELLQREREERQRDAWEKEVLEGFDKAVYKEPAKMRPAQWYYHYRSTHEDKLWVDEA